MKYIFLILALATFVAPASWVTGKGSGVPADQAEAVAQIVGFIFTAVYGICAHLDNLFTKRDR